MFDYIDTSGPPGPSRAAASGVPADQLTGSYQITIRTYYMDFKANFSLFLNTFININSLFKSF